MDEQKNSESCDQAFLQLAIFPEHAGLDDFVWRLILESNGAPEQLPHASMFDQTYAPLSTAHRRLQFASRRDTCSHFLQKLDGEDNYVFAHDAHQCLIYCARGRAKLPDIKVQLQASELLLLDELHLREGIDLHVRCNEASEVFVIRISYFV